MPLQASSTAAAVGLPHGLQRYPGHWSASGVQHSTALFQP